MEVGGGGGGREGREGEREGMAHPPEPLAPHRQNPGYGPDYANPVSYDTTKKNLSKLHKAHDLATSSFQQELRHKLNMTAANLHIT